MGFNSIMKIFMPKDRIFYSLFEQVAETWLRWADLKEVVTEPDFDKRAALISQIEDLEHVNDDLPIRFY